MNKNKQVLLGIVAAVVVLCVVVAIVVNQREHEDDQNTIKIGAILPMTGELSFYGEWGKNAFSMIEADNPDVRFFIEDSEGIPRSGLSAARKLLHNDNITFFVTSLSFIASAIQPVFDEIKVPNVTLSMDEELERESPYNFRVYISLIDEMKKLIEFVDTHGLSSVAVIYADIPAARGAVEHFLVPELNKRNIGIITEPFNLGARDYRSHLITISRGNPDIIRIIDVADNLASILQQFEEGKFSPETRFIVSGVEALFMDTKRLTSTMEEKFYFTAPPAVFSDDNLFIESYEIKYGKRPSYDAMLAYDAAMMLIKSIRASSNRNDTDSVVANFLSIGTYSGVAGEYTINEYGGASPRINWAQYKNGIPVFCE